MYEGYCKTDKPEPAAGAGEARHKPAEVHGVAAAAGGGARHATGSRGWRANAWPLFLLVSTGAAWGATFSLARIATTAGAHPIGLTLWQGLFGGLLLLALALARRRPPPLTRGHLGFYLICGLLGTAIPSVLYFYAAARVPAGVLSITIAMVPMLTFAAALLFRIDRLSWGRVFGVLCGLAAVLFIVLPESSLPDRAMVPWVLLAVLATVCYACEGIYVALRRPADSDPAGTVGAMLLTASVVLVPVILATDTFVPLGYPWGEVEWAVMGMMAVNALSYSVFYHLIQIAGPVFATQMAYVVTIAGVAWGIAIFGEQHSLWVWGALVLMLAGLALVTPRAEDAKGGKYAKDGKET